MSRLNYSSFICLLFTLLQTKNYLEGRMDKKGKTGVLISAAVCVKWEWTDFGVPPQTCIIRPIIHWDITDMVDWALKTNCLPILFDSMCIFIVILYAIKRQIFVLIISNNDSVFLQLENRFVAKCWCIISCLKRPTLCVTMFILIGKG